MQCNRCRDDPVIFQPSAGRQLCRDHFIADFEARAKRAIRQYRWMLPGDRIAVPGAGDPASRALLRFLQQLTAGRRDVSLVTLACDDAPPAQRQEIDFKAAGRCGATRIALPASLDDMAVSVLSDMLRGCRGALTHSADLHPHDGTPAFRIYPFCRIPEEEILLYASLQGIDSPAAPRPDTRGAFDDEVRALLDGYTRAHPGTKYAVAGLGRELAACRLRGAVRP
jgi:hypothetical protein